MTADFELAERKIKSPGAPPSTRVAETLVITNGDNAAARLDAAGVAGEILAWRDVLHDGPVPSAGDLESLSAIRAEFISWDLGLKADEVAAEFAARDAVMRRHGEFARVEIWLEHDLYDQLQLLQILDFFHTEGRTSGLYLVQADDYLGRQQPDAINDLSRRAETVTDDQLHLAAAVWAAFTAQTPHALATFVGADTRALPHLGRALIRLLAELPDPVRGLTLTEERALSRLAEQETTAGELFRLVCEDDEAQFLGDTSFFRRLDGLAFGRKPLIEGLPAPSQSLGGLGRSPDRGYAEFARATLRLTRAGRAVLAGRRDHRVLNSANHWVGGVHVSAGAMIRYDRVNARVVAPD